MPTTWSLIIETCTYDVTQIVIIMIPSGYVDTVAMYLVLQLALSLPYVKNRISGANM